MNTGQLAYQNGDETSGNVKPTESYILEQYLPLVKRITYQLRSHCGTTLSIEDMEQIGMMALLESSRRYPGGLDSGFISFVSQRIRGAILDELRRQDWRPRPVRQQAHELNDTVRKLSSGLGREPTDKEVALALRIDLKTYRERLHDSLSDSMKSLDELLDSGSYFVDEGSVLGEFSPKETLFKAISKLNRRDQVILSLYYQHELNLREIAATLGLTETRICQLHKCAIKQIQQLLQKWNE